MYSITIKYYCKIGYFSLDFMLSDRVWCVKCLDRGDRIVTAINIHTKASQKRKFGE